MPTLNVRGKLVGEGLEDKIPIEYIIDWFRERITRRGIVNRVLVLKSETASGKSTVIPPRLWKAKLGDPKRGMIVTQPRIVTTIENVKQIRKWNADLTSKDIGHSTKYDKMRPAKYGILSATIGTLTTELATSTDEQIISKYQYIMIDEAHERSIALDMTLMALRNFLLRCETRDDCPFVILGSATFDETVYLSFFGVPRETNFIWCAGATEPIDERWGYMGTHTSPDYIKTATSIISDISQNDDETRSDVLVFMPGGAEISELRDSLEAINVGLARKKPRAVFDLLTLESKQVNTYSREHQRLFAKLADLRVTVEGKEYTPLRRVVLSTNVAETGLTLDDLKYVIDTGYSREVEYNAAVNAAGLLTRPAPRSRIRQRRGRVGRNAPGVFYPMYPEYIHERLLFVQYPDIITSSCFDEVVMKVAAEQYRDGGDITAPFDPSLVRLVDMPPAESMRAAIWTLHKIGMMYDGRFTRLGQIAMQLRDIPPDHVRVILACYYWGVNPADMIVALAYARSFPKGGAKINWCAVYGAALVDGVPLVQGANACQALRLLMCDNFIDGIVLYNALRYIKPSNYIKYGIELDAVAAFTELVDDMIGMVTLAGLRAYTGEPFLRGLGPDSVARFKHALYDGFYHNLVVIEGELRRYRQVWWSRERVSVPEILAEKADDSTANATKKMSVTILPKYLICHRFEIKYNKHKYVHVLKAPIVSVLDGYLSPDF